MNEILQLINSKKLRPEHIKFYLKKNNKDLYNHIELLDCNFNFLLKFIMIYHGINPSELICKNCHCRINKITKRSFNYMIHNKNIFDFCDKCYYESSGNKKKQIDNRKNTIKQNNTFKMEEVREKVKKTYLQHYGVDHPSKCKEIQDKIKRTNIKKYGNNYQTILTNRMTQTMLSKYGETTNLKTKETKEKSKQTLLNHYGVDNYSKSFERKLSYIKSKYNSLKNNELIEPLFSLEDLLVNNISLNWKCKKCGNIFQSKFDYNYPQRARCLKCFPLMSGQSNMEKEAIQFIKNLGIELDIKRRDIIQPLELDIYIPSKNLAIEFDGLYWHSDQCVLNHRYHLQKTEECEKKGIQLIHIFEDEWTLGKEIVKSRLKNLLGIQEKRIYARKCEIKEIDFEICKQFLIENHIQSYSVSKINIGLFYNNQLVSVMTFGSYRKALGRNNIDNEYELLRYCTIKNTSVIGGASKLLKYFERKYKPHAIISYADRRWSQGKLYYQLGFEFIKNCSINYWYFNTKDMIRYHRFKFRKNNLRNILENYDPELSEYQNMINNHYSRIWDCGNILFQKRY